MTKVPPRQTTNNVPSNRTPPSRVGGGGGENNSNNQHAVEEMTQKLIDMQINMEGLEKERDFYFSKLRDIEIL